MIQSPLVATASSQKVWFETERHFPRVVRWIRQWWIARRTRRIVAELTNEQLADTGIDPSLVIGPVSIQMVERGFHTKAAGWR
ncbi:DUF1127 domain-containing protein [Microvirga lotononidis]|uniref:YjiS-like domain-containing protein n=1 Tax=Microvirga lotononidis TaxID=864069 RepID=I4Z2Q3_9HYPH|nr:DUF1127 domain-containing protein [Microvirga lotononidis]EIM30495.1 protein of unknown function (DUF1127) [Microvirga lotononidis]WQO26332.1 DUF1127 domain-containing protein [Microvirga lotononidis]